MHPPGGPTTRGAALPTSTAVAENVGKQVLAERRGSLRELTKLLEPHGDALRPGEERLASLAIRSLKRHS